MRLLRASLAAILLVIGLVPTVALGATQMSTPYPSVVADPGTTVKFPVAVQTDTPQRVDISVQSQPEGWSTRLQGGGSTIAAVSTANSGAITGGTESPVPVTGNFAQFTAEVSVPEATASGSQQVVLAGTGTDGTTAQLTLDVNVQTGRSGLGRTDDGLPEPDRPDFDHVQVQPQADATTPTSRSRSGSRRTRPPAGP